MCFDFLDKEEWFLDLKSEFLNEWKNRNFAKGFSPWFLSKNRLFSHRFFFLSKESQKETCFDILDTKECCLDLKSEVLKKWKKSKFLKGVLTRGFCQKIVFFSHKFFLSKKARKKHVLIFWIENNDFYTWKVNFLESEKNRNFGKGLVHGFCKKIDLFLIGFFSAKKARKKHVLIFWIEMNYF